MNTTGGLHMRWVLMNARVKRVGSGNGICARTWGYDRDVFYCRILSWERYGNGSPVSCTVCGQDCQFRGYQNVMSQRRLRNDANTFSQFLIPCSYKRQSHVYLLEFIKGEISGSNGSEYKDDCFLGCCAV
jgi:hypothetical protein